MANYVCNEKNMNVGECMTVLDELIYYCNDPEPVGALMLTGEWGCGKSYFVDHDFTDAVKGKCIIVKVSLFGIASIEALHAAIKAVWLDCLMNNLDDAGNRTKFKAWAEKHKGRIVSLVGNLGKPGELVQQVSGTIDLKDLCPLESDIDGRTVVIVFDDMERSRLDQTDLLGCINDYCENKHIHVIVIANEEKINIKHNEPNNNATRVEGKDDVKHVVVENLYMQEVKEEIPYREIKEKAIQRTVAYTPDFKAIIESIVDSFKLPDDSSPEYVAYFGYQKFLSEHKAELVGIFEAGIPQGPDTIALTDEEKEKVQTASNPHNLRSFKCAVHDFFRVHRALAEHRIDEIEKYLYSFVMFVMAHKAGIELDSSMFGDIFEDLAIKEAYPVFYNKNYMLRAAREWVLKGEWKEDLLIEEINWILEKKRGASSEDIVRLSRIIDLEEKTIEEGFPGVLQLAYDGKLSLDEYVYLITNSFLSREFEYPLPENIEWDRVMDGIKTKCQEMIDGNCEDHSGSILTSITSYSKEEKVAYNLIKEFRDRNGQMFATNRKQYLDLMKTDPYEVFVICGSKRFDKFDEEMAKVTAGAFRETNNAGKCMFPEEFKRLWAARCNGDQDIKANETVAGFEALARLLNSEKQRLEAGNLRIAKKHTERFIKVVNELTGNLRRQYNLLSKDCAQTESDTEK